MSDLHIAEIPFADGRIRYRYARRLSPDGTRWLRHGLFRAFHPNGALASMGTYANDVEDGPWEDFHDNGQLAAAGTYQAGEQAADWRYWNDQGLEEISNPNPA